MKTALLVMACAFTYAANAQTNHSKAFDDADLVMNTPSRAPVFKKKIYNAEILSRTIVSGKLKLKINKATTLSFYGSDGRLLYSKQLEAGLQTVDVGNYPKGEYFVNTVDATLKISIE